MPRGVCWIGLLVVHVAPTIGLAQQEPLSAGEIVARMFQSHSLTIRGAARDQDGKAVAGARIFVVSANSRRPSSASPVLAETRSDASGNSVFRELMLPVVVSQGGPVDKPTQGEFQVYGVTAGYGFTWHPMQTFRPETRPAEEVDTKNHIFSGEDCVAELTFEPAATISGQIIDDSGQPLAGARVMVGRVEDVRRPGSGYSSLCEYLGPNAGETPVRDWFAAMPYLTENVFSAVTDEQGRYTIGGLRRETAYLARISYLPEYDSWSGTVATTERPLDAFTRSVGHAGRLDQTLNAPRTVTLAVNAADTNQPLADVVVRARGQRIKHSGNLAKTNGDGRATLEVTPGKYKLFLEPSKAMHYVLTEAEVDVKEGALNGSAVVVVNAGAVLDIRAVEAGSGLPIAGVSFLEEIEAGTRRRPLQSQTVYVDYPTTGADGKLRAITGTGSRRLVVAGYPKEWEPVTKSSELLALAAGETYQVKFAFKRVAEAEPQAPAGDELAELRALVQRQEALSQAGRFRLRHHSSSLDGVSPADLRALFAVWDFATVPDIAANLNERFPKLNFGFSNLTIVADGKKLRNESAYRGPDATRATITTVVNGHETIMLNPDNAQASIYDRGRHILGSEEVTRWPFVPLPNAKPALRIHLERKGGRMTMTLEGEHSRGRQIIDDATGFLYHRSIEFGKEWDSGGEIWQFAPRPVEGGAIVAGLSAELAYSPERVQYLRVSVLEDASFEPPPAEAFVVAAPPGTNVVDFRGNRSSPKTGVAYEPVTDVLMFANAIPDDHRSVLPVLKIGQPAPKLAPAAWLTASGESEAPDLTGKVVLVDFWGTNCGPCVAELPEIQELHKRLAASGLVIVGLHESGGDVAAVAELARRFGLSYQLAIDRTAADSHGFGATFKGYGVQGIPNCAVIDKEGRLAYLGKFAQAADAAARLLAASK